MYGLIPYRLNGLVNADGILCNEYNKNYTVDLDIVFQIVKISSNQIIYLIYSYLNLLY